MYRAMYKKVGKNMSSAIFQIYQDNKKKDLQPFQKDKNNQIPSEFDLNSFYRYLMEGADAGRSLGNIRDPIYSKYGGFSEAERAFLDPQVSACHLLKVFAVLNKEIIFKPACNLTKKRDIKKSKDIADFLNFAVKKIKPSDIQMRFDMLTSMFFGYSFTELVYDVIKGTSKKYNNYYYYSRAKAKRPGLWAFHFDNYGNIDGYQSLLDKSFIADIRQIMAMSWLPLWNNPHGTGDYLKIRRFEKAKREFIIFLLTLGARQAKGKQNIVQGDSDLSDEAGSQHEELLDQLNNYLSVYCDKKYDLKFEKFDTQALEDFLKVLRWLDTQISIAMLSNSMTTNQNEKSGSHAMAAAQIEHGTYSFESYACQIMANALDDQFAKNLIYLNYDLNEYPEELHPYAELIDPEHINLEAQAQLDELLSRLGILDLNTKADLIDRRLKYNLPDNPELFNDEEEAAGADSEDKLSIKAVINLVRKLERQMSKDSSISKKIQEILNNDEPEPEYIEPEPELA